MHAGIGRVHRPVLRVLAGLGCILGAQVTGLCLPSSGSCPWTGSCCLCLDWVFPNPLQPWARTCTCVRGRDVLPGCRLCAVWQEEARTAAPLSPACLAFLAAHV